MFTCLSPKLPCLCNVALSAAPSGNDVDPEVRITVRISSTVAEVSTVESQIRYAFRNTSDPQSFVQNFNARGHNLTSAAIDSITSSLVSTLVALGDNSIAGVTLFLAGLLLIP